MRDALLSQWVDCSRETEGNRRRLNREYGGNWIHLTLRLRAINSGRPCRQAFHGLSYSEWNGCLHAERHESLVNNRSSQVGEKSTYVHNNNNNKK